MNSPFALRHRRAPDPDPLHRPRHVERRQRVHAVGSRRLERGVIVPAVEGDVSHGHKRGSVVSVGVCCCNVWVHGVRSAQDGAARVPQRRRLARELGIVGSEAGGCFWVGGREDLTGGLGVSHWCGSRNSSASLARYDGRRILSVCVNSDRRQGEGREPAKTIGCHSRSNADQSSLPAVAAASSRRRPVSSRTPRAAVSYARHGLGSRGPTARG